MKHLEVKEVLDILSGFGARGIVLSLDDPGWNVKDLSTSDKELLKQQEHEIVLFLKQTRQAFSGIKPISNKEHYTFHLLNEGSGCLASLKKPLLFITSLSALYWREK